MNRDLKKRLLFVDDEENLRRLFMHVFEDRGLQLKTASSFDEAVAELNETPFDVVISDINMPRKSGLELLRSIKDIRPDACVILITGNPTVGTAAEAVRHGAFDYLIKPFNIAILERVVNKAFHQKEKLDEKRRLEKIEHKYIESLEATLDDQNQEIRKTYQFLEKAHIKSLEVLATAVDYRDDDTGNHVVRIGEYATLLAGWKGLPAKKIEILHHAAPMHDVGKIGIPDAILRKPGKLTAEEFEIMKQHTIIGAKIFYNSEHPYHIASGIIALTHHERYDGCGYPRGQKGEQIHIFGRIVALVDVFDALTSYRVYKKAWTDEDALALIREEKGEQFDPELAQLFLENFSEIKQTRERLEKTSGTNQFSALDSFPSLEF